MVEVQSTEISIAIYYQISNQGAEHRYIYVTITDSFYNLVVLQNNIQWEIHMFKHIFILFLQ